MNKILFVVYDMLPYAYTWGGCQRMYFLAQKLISRGDFVKVIANNTSVYNDFGREKLPNVRFVHQPIEKKATVEGNKTESNIKRFGLLRVLYHQTDKFLFNEIIPGAGFRSFKKCKDGLKVIEEELSQESYDVAVVSAPPFNLFRHIKTIRKNSPQTKIIMDYRDPWNSWHSGNMITTLREKRLQKIADIIVCTNDALCDDMSQKFRINRNRYRTVANGFMGSVATAETSCVSYDRNDRMTITYTGSIGFGPHCEEYRDTHNLIAAIKELKAQGIADFKFVFVGVDTNNPDIAAIKDSLGDLIEFVGVVSSSKAKEYSRNADACLVIHTANDNSGRFLISGKMYDYIQNKKYVISIGRSDCQHAIIVSKYNIGKNAENSAESIKSAIVECLHLWKTGNLKGDYDSFDVNTFSREYQIQRYIDIIEQLS